MTMDAFQQIIELLKELSRQASESVGAEVSVSFKPTAMLSQPEFSFEWVETSGKLYDPGESRRVIVALSLDEIDRVAASVAQMAMGRFHLLTGRRSIQDGKFRVG